MELRTASARGSDTNCRGSIVNQLSGRRARPSDLRRVGVAETMYAALWAAQVYAEVVDSALLLPYR